MQDRQPAPERASIIFTGGRVHTVDAHNTIAEAVAIGGDRILAVGSDATVRGWAGPATRHVALRGRSLLPGFIDAHAHLVSLGASRLAIDCTAPGMDSIAALVEAVRGRAAMQPRGTWIRGYSYDEMLVAENRAPSRFDFDPVSPDHPVVFTRSCGHAVAVNTRAMELVGVRDDTPDPPGGRLDRIDGKVSGVVYENAAAPFRLASGYSAAECRQALSTANEMCLRDGCTSVHDAGGLDRLALNVAQELIEADALQVRIYAFVTAHQGSPLLAFPDTGLRTGFGDDRLRIGAFKLGADGSSSAPTAATRAPYTSNPKDSGILRWTQAELDELLGRAHRLGWQVTAHAVGDRGIEVSLNAMERAMRAHPRTGLRHRLEHCGICPPDLQARIQALGVIPVVQPAFFWQYGDGYLRDYGAARVGVMFPARSLLAAGVPVAGSSDTPAPITSPLFDLELAMTRATVSGQVCGAAERVDLTSALRMHTIHGAYAAFEEERKGSLEVGKLADLVVVGEDLERVPVERIGQVGVAMTVIGGRVRYEADRG